MKKSLILLTAITALSFALTPCLPLQSASAVTDDYSVAGGRCVVEFEDSKDGGCCLICIRNSIKRPGSWKENCLPGRWRNKK